MRFDEETVINIVDYINQMPFSKYQELSPNEYPRLPLIKYYASTLKKLNEVMGTPFSGERGVYKFSCYSENGIVGLRVEDKHGKVQIYTEHDGCDVYSNDEEFAQFE